VLAFHVVPGCAENADIEGICFGDRRAIYADSCEECIQTSGACRTRCEEILAARSPACADAGHAHFRCLFEEGARSLTCSGDEPEWYTYQSRCTAERDAFVSVCGLSLSDAGADGAAADGAAADGAPRDASAVDSSTERDAISDRDGTD